MQNNFLLKKLTLHKKLIDKVPRHWRDPRRIQRRQIDAPLQHLLETGGEWEGHTSRHESGEGEADPALILHLVLKILQFEN